MTPMIAADFAFVTLYKRLRGLLCGDFPADWPAEPYALMRAVWGAWS